MGVLVALPLKENTHVQNYLKALNENNRSTGDFTTLLNAVEMLEDMLTQSYKDMADMKKQLSELKEIQSHPVKTAINNILISIKENADTAMAWLTAIKGHIINGCKKIVESMKDAGVSALDNVASFLKLKDGLETIGKKVAENNALCDKAIKSIESFSSEYHKSGRSLKNMGLIMLGKEPVDAVKENGKLAMAFAAPYRTAKALWANVERKAFVMARDLSDFHTRTQIKREDKKETKKARKVDKADKGGKSQKTDIFKAVDRHKENTESNKKDKTHEKKKANEER